MASLTPVRTAPLDPAAALAERLSDPKTAAALNTILDHADLLAILVTGLDGFISRGDTIADSLVGGVTELRAAGQQTTARASDLIATARQLSALLPQIADKMPVLERLVSSDLADPRLIDLASTVSRAAITGAAQAGGPEIKVTGLRGLLRALKDPDISRALGFVMSVAKALGRDLSR